MGFFPFGRGYLLTSCWHAGGALSFPVPQTAIHGCFLSGPPPWRVLRTHLPSNSAYTPWSMTAPLTSASSGYAPPSHIICVSTGDVLATVKKWRLTSDCTNYPEQTVDSQLILLTFWLFYIYLKWLVMIQSTSANYPWQMESFLYHLIFPQLVLMMFNNVYNRE